MDMGRSHATGEVTRLLRAVADGERDALDRLFPLVYGELRDVAARQLRRQTGGHTLHATDLVHESYLKLARGAGGAADRAHFLAIAARAMRQVLVDHARRRGAEKRGGGAVATTLTGDIAERALAADELLALDDALASLEPRQRQVVECRYFGGMEETEIALALGVSERTVRRDWVKARAWLHHALAGEDPLPAAPPAV
jgi:RNA polymerase sigma factor (TIGR02999 family)